MRDTTDWVSVDYVYDCPADNYLDGSMNVKAKQNYFGPKNLYVIVHKDTGEIYDVLIQEEIDDGRPTPFGHVVIELDATVDPLVVEVLSDYHNNFEPEDMDDSNLELRSIGLYGYQKFQYTYPIHPDELYDDKRCYYDFSTKKFVLVKNTNEDIIGAFPGWTITKQRRNFWLRESDIWLMNPTLTEDQKAEIEVYKQKLRDMPNLWQASDLDDIFADSCWPAKPSFVSDDEPL